MLAGFDIVLVAFPFMDGPNVKPGPAMVICLSKHHQDVLLAFISSKIAGAAHSDELAIRADQPQFHQSGLKVSSRCRLSSLTTLAAAPRPSTDRQAARGPPASRRAYPAEDCRYGNLMNKLCRADRFSDPPHNRRIDRPASDCSIARRISDWTGFFGSPCAVGDLEK